MLHEIVSSLDSTLHVMLFGIVDAWALHPFVASSIVVALLILAAMLWAELLDNRDEDMASDLHSDTGARS